MNVTPEMLEQRLVRYDALIPCKTAFIDARTPGSDQKENFTIIGPGVAEYPGQHVHIKIPHGFNIGGARQPKGCVNSQHSHISEEVFLVHSGSWCFRWGEWGEDGEVVLTAGDVISIPVNVFRGFENVSDAPGYLFAILGNDDPGHVTWAPHVYERAADHGLVLLESGRLVDLKAGEKIPPGEKPCQATTPEDAAALRRMTAAEMRACVVRAEELAFSTITGLACNGVGVEEAPILGPANALENVGAGKVSTPHGFQFRQLRLAAGAKIPLHTRQEEEVLFVHAGHIAIEFSNHTVKMGPGDTFSTPIGMPRRWFVTETGGADVFIVRRGDQPEAAAWCAA